MAEELYCVQDTLSKLEGIYGELLEIKKLRNMVGSNAEMKESKRDLTDQAKELEEQAKGVIREFNERLREIKKEYRA